MHRPILPTTPNFQSLQSFSGQCTNGAIYRYTILQIHNSLKLKMKDSLAHIKNDWCRVNGAFRSLWITNSEVTNIEVHLKYFFSKIHLFTGPNRTAPCCCWCFFFYFSNFLLFLRLQNLSIISFTTESEGVWFSCRFDVTNYFATT